MYDWDNLDHKRGKCRFSSSRQWEIDSLFTGECPSYVMLCASHYHLLIFQKYTRVAGHIQDHPKE